MKTSMTIQAREAALLAAACIQAAETRKVAIAVAVVDSSGQPLRLERMDGARGFSSDLATRKARTATIIGVSTGMLAASLNGLPLHSPDLIAVAGGAPLVHLSTLAGGVGVSGGTPEQDEDIVAAAITEFEQVVSAGNKP